MQIPPCRDGALQSLLCPRREHCPSCCFAGRCLSRSADIDWAALKPGRNFRHYRIDLVRAALGMHMQFNEAVARMLCDCAGTWLSPDWRFDRHGHFAFTSPHTNFTFADKIEILIAVCSDSRTWICGQKPALCSASECFSGK